MKGTLRVRELAAIIGVVSSLLMIMFYVVYTPQVVWVEQSNSICPEKLSFSNVYKSESFEMVVRNGGTLPAIVVVCISVDNNAIKVLKQCKSYWIDAKQDTTFGFPLNLDGKKVPKNFAIEVNAYCYWTRPLNFLPCMGSSAVCKYVKSRYSPYDYELAAGQIVG